MTGEIISKETLQEKLDAITHSITPKRWKYYHIESIQNFIFHLDSFPSERTQERMAGKLGSYLSLLQKRINQEHDLHSLARELYPSVWSIADEYKYGLGFISKPSYYFHFIIWVVLFFILKYSFAAWISFGVVAAIAIITIIRTQKKIKARKYY